MYPVNCGETMPGTVANVLEMPIRTLACCGATSKWLTLKMNGNVIEKGMGKRRVIPRLSLRKSTPGKRSQAYGSDNTDNAQRWITNVRSGHHEYRLGQKTAAIEISSNLCRCQPATHLAHIG